MSKQSKTTHTDQQSISRFKSLIDDLKRKFSHANQQNTEKENVLESRNDKPYKQSILIVSIAEQRLYYLKNHKLDKSYLISTAEAGVGNLSGSYQTPLGTHRIAEKFGENAPIRSIFKARKNTHQIANIIHEPNIRSDDDNITSRILWLEGLEAGINKGFNKNKKSVDSFSRYIYIHGTDEEGLLGKPASHGCVRMANKEIIELFETIEIGDIVIITES